MVKIYQSVPVQTSEITPEQHYRSRRQFLKAMGIVGAGAAIIAACAPLINSTEQPEVGVDGPTIAAPVETLTPFEAITNYNNYYEFSLDKESVAVLAKDFPTSPWQVKVYGLVNKPKTFSIEELLQFPQEERIYRLRCVEAWSMVIPWVGFPLHLLLSEVEPLPSAKFVRFETVQDSDHMPNLRNRRFPWPYQEGLRLDEAMHDLTILATGLYGQPLPNQDGAPIRLVVPWKYGFKSSKSLIKIELVADQPDTFWSTTAPDEYGFYSNVNPEVSHPRWSQASERRIGESERRPTLMFNGYAEEVASLYEGMDLSVYF